MTQTMEAPSKIQVFYRTVEGAHVFTSDDLPGLHVLRNDLKAAHDLLLKVASELVFRAYGTRAEYMVAKGFEGLEELIKHRNPLLASTVVLMRAASPGTTPQERQKVAA